MSITLDEMTRRKVFPKRLVIASTRAVYGEGPYRRPADGAVVYPDQRSKADLEAGRFEFDNMIPLDMDAIEHMPKPSSVYGTTKLAQESLLIHWARSFEIPSYTFRLQNVYGGGQSLSNPYTGVLIHFMKQVALGKDVLIYEQGGITRDFVHVSDVARILAAAVNGEGEPGVYDVGSELLSKVVYEKFIKRRSDLISSPQCHL